LADKVLARDVHIHNLCHSHIECYSSLPGLLIHIKEIIIDIISNNHKNSFSSYYEPCNAVKNIIYIFSVKEEIIMDWSSCNLIKIELYLRNEIGGIVLDELVSNKYH